MPKGSNSVGVCVVRTVERQDTTAPPRPGPAPDSHPEVGRLTPGLSSQPFRGSPVHQPSRWLKTTRETRPHKPLMTSRSGKNRGCGWAYAGAQARRYRPSSSHLKFDVNRPRPSAEVAQQSDQDRPVPLTRRLRSGNIPDQQIVSTMSRRALRGAGPTARLEKGPMDGGLAIAVGWLAVAIVVALLIGRSIRLADLNAKLARAPDEPPSVVEDVPDLVEDEPDLVEDEPDLVEDEPDLVEDEPELVEDEPRAEVAAPDEMPGDVSPSSGPQGDAGSATAPGESRASAILPPHHPAVRPPTGRRPAAPKRTHPTGPIG